MSQHSSFHMSMPWQRCIRGLPYKRVGHWRNVWLIKELGKLYCVTVFRMFLEKEPHSWGTFMRRWQIIMLETMMTSLDCSRTKRLEIYLDPGFRKRQSCTVSQTGDCF